MRQCSPMVFSITTRFPFFRNLTNGERGSTLSMCLPKTRRTVTISLELVEAAKQRGLSIGDYALQLHHNQRSARVAYVSSIFRGFALLEMARVPVDPAYFELVEGCMSETESREFRIPRLERGGQRPGARSGAVAWGRYAPVGGTGALAGGVAFAGFARGLYRGGAAARGDLLPVRFAEAGLSDSFENLKCGAPGPSLHFRYERLLRPSENLPFRCSPKTGRAPG